jgi:aconitate hydratase
LSRKDPGYVGRTKAIQQLEARRQQLLREGGLFQELEEAFLPLVKAGLLTKEQLPQLLKNTGLGSVVFAMKPGDGSAREQAASCQRVLGGDANIAIEYATKRYRSNLINWGMLPFSINKEDIAKLTIDGYIFIQGIRQHVAAGAETVPAWIINDEGKLPLVLKLENLSQAERDIILSGCLINYYSV